MEQSKKLIREIIGSLVGGLVLSQLLFLILTQKVILNPINPKFIFVYFSSTVAVYMGIGVVRDIRTKRRIRQLAQNQASQRSEQQHDIDWHAGLRSEKAQTKDPAKPQDQITAAKDK